MLTFSEINQEECCAMPSNENQNLKCRLAVSKDLCQEQEIFAIKSLKRLRLKASPKLKKRLLRVNSGKKFFILPFINSLRLGTDLHLKENMWLKGQYKLFITSLYFL